jgi:hypothetical protein
MRLTQEQIERLEDAQAWVAEIEGEGEGPSSPEWTEASNNLDDVKDIIASELGITVRELEKFI